MIGTTTPIFRHTPKSIRKYLDSYVVGQDEAKDAISAIGFLHYVRYVRAKNPKHKKLKKTNVVLTGPTGCGKTLLLERLAEHLGLPFLMVPAPDITREGFVGESMISRLETFAKEFGANEYLSDAEREKFNFAIIFIDEIDKLCGRVVTTGSSDHNADIQASLLKIIEGSEVSKKYQIRTDQMLFVFAGAFPYTRIRREEKKKAIGYIRDSGVTEEVDKQEELIEAGLMAELVGRVGHIIELKELTKDELVQILKLPKGTLVESHRELFQYMGYEFELTDEELEEIANKAIKRKTGARSLDVELESRILKLTKDIR